MEVDYPRVTHPFAGLLALAGFLPRLACVRHAASVRSEPGSNSPIIFFGSSAPGLTYFNTHSKHCGVRNLLRGLAIQFSKTGPTNLPCVRPTAGLHLLQPTTGNAISRRDSLRRPVV